MFSFYIFNRIIFSGICRTVIAGRKVAVVPGSVFGESGEGFIRCSYATSLEQLMEAMKRMERFVENKKDKT